MNYQEELRHAILDAMRNGHGGRCEELRAKYETLTLQAEQFAKSVRYESDIDFKDMIFPHMKQAVASWYIASIHSDESKEFPANWFEAVKDRFAPAWCLKRWPVRKVKLSGKMFFPQVDMTVLNKRDVLTFHRLVQTPMFPDSEEDA